VIWAMIVVIAISVANAKAEAIATKIFFHPKPLFPKCPYQSDINPDIRMLFLREITWGREATMRRH